MATAAYLNGLARRGRHTTVHASPNPPEPYTLTSYVALCGAIFRDATEVPWRTSGVPDLCPGCVAITADLGCST